MSAATGSPAVDRRRPLVSSIRLHFRKERRAATTPTEIATAAAPRRHAASVRRSSRPRRSCSAARATSTASGRTSPRPSASARRRCITTSSPSSTACTRSWPRRWRPRWSGSSASPASTRTSREALDAVLRAAFDLSEHEVLRNRLLVSEQVLVGVHRTSAREEEARQLARARTRDLEFEWATFLTRGMEQGAIPEADAAPAGARRSSGSTTASSTGTGRAAASRSPRSADFYVPRCLAVAGLPLEGVARPRTPGARPRAAAQALSRALRPRPARGSAASRAARSPCGGPRRARRRSAGSARPRRARRAGGPATRRRRRAPGSRGR